MRADTPSTRCQGGQVTTRGSSCPQSARLSQKSKHGYHPSILAPGLTLRPDLLSVASGAARCRHPITSTRPTSTRDDDLRLEKRGTSERARSQGCMRALTKNGSTSTRVSTTREFRPHYPSDPQPRAGQAHQVPAPSHLRARPSPRCSVSLLRQKTWIGWLTGQCFLASPAWTWTGAL